MNGKRKWFFLMESLQITAGERRVVMFLLAVSMITTGLAHFGSKRSIYDQPYYEPIIAEFKRLSEIHQSEYTDLLARYYPPVEFSPLTEVLLKSRSFQIISPLKSASHTTSVRSAAVEQGQPAGRRQDQQNLSGIKNNLSETLENNGSKAYSGVAEWDREQVNGIKPESYINKEFKPVRIQTADKEDLMTLPGIGPVTAGHILLYREEHGPFQNIDDLRNVSGVGPVTIENIREYILID